MKQVRITEGKSLAGLPRYFPEYKSLWWWLPFTIDVDPGMGPGSVVSYSIHFDTLPEAIAFIESKSKKKLTVVWQAMLE